MSRQVVIERYAPELPPVCVATGATAGVEYFPVKFQYVPWWARFFFGAIGAALAARKADVMVPFTPEAHKRYKRAQWIPAVIIVGGLAFVFVPMLISAKLAFVGMIAFLAALVGGLVYAMTVTKSAGPTCKHMDDAGITLVIPNDAAADAIETGVVPANAPALASSVPTTF